MLLPAETNAVLEEKCSKRYAIRSFYSGGGKMVFILLTKVITGYVVITLINIRQPCLKKMLSRAFCSRGFGFHYCSNNVLHFLIRIDPWRGFGASKSCCRCVGRPWGHCQYVERLRRSSLSGGKFIWAFKRQRWPRQSRANRLRDTTLNPTRVSASSGSHQKE